MTAHPLNAEGDFYVEHGCCTACDVPMQSAPTLFAYDDTSHCFVKRQPVTRSECDMMFEAIRGAELKCIRYRGKDNDWYRRLASSGDLDVSGTLALNKRKDKKKRNAGIRTFFW